jgi:hypothetical protein
VFLGLFCCLRQSTVLLEMKNGDHQRLFHFLKYGVVFEAIDVSLAVQSAINENEVRFVAQSGAASHHYASLELFTGTEGCGIINSSLGHLLRLLSIRQNLDSSDITTEPPLPISPVRP